MRSSLLPAATLLAILDGLGALGLDTRLVRHRAGVPTTLNDPDAPTQSDLMNAVWRVAFELAPREELALEVGSQVRLGAFGSMDYLAASRDTVGEAFDSLATQLAGIAPGRGLELERAADHFHVTLVSDEDPHVRAVFDEFTIAIVLRHFRAHTEELPVVGVQLTRPPPKHPERFAELLAATTTFGHARSAMWFEPRTVDIPLSSRDPHLLRTLLSLNSRLALVPESPPIELAIRSSLKQLLSEGRAAASEVARSVGLSERSLHRKLSAAGRSYQEVVDAFRRGEAERRLLGPDPQLSQIALYLGFADHSAFSRAFKRWAGISPSEWRKTHLAAGD